MIFISVYELHVMLYSGNFCLNRSAKFNKCVLQSQFILICNYPSELTLSFQAKVHKAPCYKDFFSKVTMKIGWVIEKKIEIHTTAHGVCLYN